MKKDIGNKINITNYQNYKGQKDIFCLSNYYNLIILLFILLVGISCSNSDNLSDEAVKKVDEIVYDKYFLKVGNDWYSKSDKGYIQLKVVNIISSCRKLTEADKLNNIEWSGFVTYECSSVRFYDLISRNWDSWRDANFLRDMDVFEPLKVRIEKTNGKWEIGEISAGKTKYSKYLSVKPEKSEIPK